SLSGNVGSQRVNKGNNMLYAYFGYFIMIHIPEAVGFGAVKSGLAVGIGIDNAGAVVIQNGLDAFQIGDGCLGGVVPAVQPIDHLVTQSGVTCIFPEGFSRFL